MGRIPPFSRPRCRPIGLTFLSFVLIASACSSSEQGVRVVRTTTTSTTEVRTGDGAIVDRATIQTGDLSGYTVFTFPGDGDDVDGQVTLDFCDVRYPSEALRTARNQVAVHDDDEPRSYAIVLSVEAVMYRDAAATEQAFRELRAARLSCSVGFRRPEISGAEPRSYEFNPPPDQTWANVPGVERLAFDFTATDQQGHSEHRVPVYLRRGRLLVGIYPGRSGLSLVVRGVAGLENLVAVIAARMRELPTA